MFTKIFNDLVIKQTGSFQAEYMPNEHYKLRVFCGCILIYINPIYLFIDEEIVCFVIQNICYSEDRLAVPASIHWTN